MDVADSKRLYGFAEFTVVNRVMWLAICDRKLHGNTLRVLCHVLASCETRNKWEGTQKAVGEALGLSASRVSEAFRDLREQGYLLRMDGARGSRHWFVDARYSFRGSAVAHDVELRRQMRQRDKDRGVALHVAEVV